MKFTPLLALKIDVPGTRAAKALPALADLLRRHQAGASFAVSLGPGFLPGTAISRNHSDILCRLRDEGFEIGIHGWSNSEWLQRIEQADAAWSKVQVEKAITAFQKILGLSPRFHAAPGWRTNRHALRLTQRLGFSHACDTRGRYPFVPVWNGEIVRCMQLPTTLPTLDELAGKTKPDPQALCSQLLALTAEAPQTGHVFSLTAGPDIIKHSESFEALLTGWREQGYELTSIQALVSRCEIDKLPRHKIVVGKVDGRTGSLLLQGDVFLSTWRNPT